MTMTETGSTVTATLTSTTAAAVGRALANVGRCASNDYGRGVLAGVHVGCDGETLTFTATDSYRLVRCEIRLNPVAGDSVIAFNPFVLDSKQACKAGKLVNRKNVDRGVGFTVTGPTFTLSTVDGSANVEIMYGVYPNVDRPLNPESTGELPRVNGWLMGELLDVMGDIVSSRKDIAPAITFHSVGGMRHPVRLSGGDDTLTVVGLIMPLKA
jgi:hypothetical protein